MRLVICRIILLNFLFIAGISGSGYTQLQVKTEVYPGVELLNVIHLLSDSAETVSSTYAADIRKRFNAYKDHPAVQKARELALLNCDFPLRQSWCFYDFPDIKLHLPDTLGAYNKYVTTKAIQEYLKACVDFYRKSNFWEFIISYQPNYEKWIRSFQHNLIDDNMLATIDGFYRLKPSHSVTFTLGPVNCNSFALPETGDINPAFRNISTIFVAYGNLYKANDSTPPRFNSTFNSQLIWHEAGHVYLADLFVKYKKEIDSLGVIFDNDATMKIQAGSLSWESYLNENITQAVTSYLRIREELTTAEKETARLVAFYSIAKLMIPIIRREYEGADLYKGFDAFFPRLLEIWAMER